jgi:hypothetical protein
MKPSEDTALVVAQKMTSEDLTALLQQAGWAEKTNADAPLRMKLEGSTLTTPDGEAYMYNPFKPDIPALTVRIVRPPEEYYGIWIDQEKASLIGRPELANSYSKKWIHHDPDRRVWDSDEAFDQLKAVGVKPQWRGEMAVQVMPPSGTLTGNEPVYLLDLSATSVAEFKGSYANPEGGSVSEINFIRKLAKLALEQATTSGEDQERALLNALTSLTLGGVVAQVRIMKAENKERAQIWYVISFDPIHIESVESGPAIEAGDVEEAAF